MITIATCPKVITFQEDKYNTIFVVANKRNRQLTDHKPVQLLIFFCLYLM